MRILSILAIVSGGLGVATPAYADAGDVLIKARGTYSVRSGSFDIALVADDTSSRAKFADALGIEASITMFFSDRIAAEVSVGGAKHDVEDGVGGTLVEGSALMTAGAIQYHFAGNEAPFRPYVGVGGAYLNFYAEDAGRILLDQAESEFTSYSASMDGKFAPFAQFGADVPINDQLYVNFDVKYATYKSEQLIETQALQSISRRIDSVVAAAGIGFRF